MHSFKSAIFPELKNCQNGTFEPVHGIQNVSQKGLTRFQKFFSI
jgi:hypothetical protein